MPALSRSLACLSMAGIGLAAQLLTPAVQAGAVGKPLVYGRWAVSENRPVFTARGRLYKTVDIAPCGSDFCGVSVSDNRQCGPVLFRFLPEHSASFELHGHGLWGDQKKNIQIYAPTSDTQAKNNLELFLGDGTDFGERSGNIPTYHAQYRRAGAASCSAR